MSTEDILCKQFGISKTVFNYVTNMEKKIKEKVRGAVTKTITKDAVREIKIMIPPIELQNQFASFVKQVDKLKFEMEKSLKELEDNFNSLMEKAFNEELLK